MRLYYGWWLVLVCVLLQAIGVGASIYLYSVIAAALEAELRGSRALLMAGASGLFLMGALLSPRVGRLLDRYPLRHILSGGALLMGLGFVLIALSTHIWQVVLCYTLFIAAGMATLSQLSSATLLSRWFLRRRGLALGIAALGTQLGGLSLPPLLALLIELYEWRLAVAALGLGIALLLPLLVQLSVVDHPPADAAIDDPTDDTAASPELSDALPAPGMRQLLGQRRFLCVVLIMGSLNAVHVALLANLSLFAIDLGETPARAAGLIAWLAVVGMCASPIAGRLCDQLSLRSMTGLLLALTASALLTFSLAGSWPLLVLATFFQALAGAGISPLWAIMVARLYPASVFGAVLGASTLFVFLGIALAPAAAGWIHDLSGSYRLLFLGLLAIIGVSLLLTPGLPGSTATPRTSTPA